MRTQDLETAVVALLDYRKNLIVPNVSYGWGLSHEADIIYLTDSNYCHEVEIKISKSDLLADLKKEKHKRVSKIICSLTYCIPENLLDVFLQNFDDKFGVITVKEVRHLDEIKFYKASWYRRPKKTKDVRPVDIRKRLKLAELGCMRIWTLKNHLKIKRERLKSSEVNH